MKLKNKIHLGTSVLLIVIVIVMNTAVYFAAGSMLKEADLDRTVAEARRIMTGVLNPAASVSSADLLRAYAPADGMVRIILPDSTVDGVSASPGAIDLRDIEAVYETAEQRNVIEVGSARYARVIAPVIWRNGDVASLEIMENLQATDRILDILRIVLIAASILAVIPAVISARVLGTVISNPIVNLTQTMRHIRESGRYEQIEMNSKQNDELNEMAETFNDMMEQLEKNYVKQETFVQNASHELKTPLTVVESYANLLKRRGKDRPDLFDESVEAIHEEAVRMKELTQQLLTLARSNESWNIQKESVHVASFVKEAAEAFEKAYDRRIDVGVHAPFTIITDRSKLRQILYIFLDNARKYSDDEIHLLVEKNEIHVIDKGIGIPSSDIDKIFDRFYRVDKARSRKTRGFGLGLSLAKDIAVAIGADVKIESEEGKGTTAIITLSDISEYRATMNEKTE
ncbi:MULTISPECIES: HAMP domain-containing sensor histidine kinase [Bacillaceae]|uniref:histidine kinase n=1 Tax=Domibacillus aminovorans TaxID=29332 RepID=A0A177KJK1_9BACI|nr:MULTISPECIES: HAMP domain-containing sensor histidine kinase [Bacillaceae]OAH53572.1 hypothetical protein AWH48_09815 [Domibacillus aminovorans]